VWPHWPVINLNKAVSRSSTNPTAVLDHQQLKLEGKEKKGLSCLYTLTCVQLDRIIHGRETAKTKAQQQNTIHVKGRQMKTRQQVVVYNTHGILRPGYIMPVWPIGDQNTQALHYPGSCCWIVMSLFFFVFFFSFNIETTTCPNRSIYDGSQATDGISAFILKALKFVRGFTKRCHVSGFLVMEPAMRNQVVVRSSIPITIAISSSKRKIKRHTDSQDFVVIRISNPAADFSQPTFKKINAFILFFLNLQTLKINAIYGAVCTSLFLDSRPD
jgi:hypothetical protein